MKVKRQDEVINQQTERDILHQKIQSDYDRSGSDISEKCEFEYIFQHRLKKHSSAVAPRNISTYRYLMP